MNLRIIALALAFTRATSPGAILWVAPNGDDRNRGTESSPFASIQRAHKSADPGDTVCVRGGEYKMSEKQIHTVQRGQAHVICLEKSGTEKKPIRYWAYPGEKPVFDFSDVKPRDLRVTAFRVNGSWIHLKGLAVTGVQVTITGHTQSICYDNQGSHNIYECLEAHDGQAIGFWLGRGTDNLVLNCDAYRNYDSTSENGKGGNTDGFGFHGGKGNTGNRFKGCRAWFNSDDGYDLISAGEPVIIENCWAFYNGMTPDFKGRADGNGFKAGGYGAKAGETLPDPVPRHVIRGCLAVRNRAAGFYANHHPGGNDWLNNTAYLNSVNFNMLGRNAANTASVPGAGHRLKNNLGYKGRRETSNLDEAICDASGNYFNMPLEAEDRDFLGLDDKDLVAPRQPNGDLPKIQLMHLKRGSKLIDRGTDVGLPFLGKAPDLGAFEAGAE